MPMPAQSHAVARPAPSSTASSDTAAVASLLLPDRPAASRR